MPNEVNDTNVLMLGTAAEAGWSRPRVPIDEPAVLQRVHRWLTEFRQDPTRLLVIDFAEKTILVEYFRAGNMPTRDLYGRRIVQHKFDTGAIRDVDLTYWYNGSEAVADLPPEIADLVHDLGDRKLIAAAMNSGANIFNATDSDWTEPNVCRALELAGVRVVQLLSEAELRACSTRSELP